MLYTCWKHGVEGACCSSNFRLETDEVSMSVRRSGAYHSLKWRNPFLSRSDGLFSGLHFPHFTFRDKKVRKVYRSFELASRLHKGGGKGKLRQLDFNGFT